MAHFAEIDANNIVIRAYRVIDLLRPEPAVDHYRLATHGSLDLLKKFRQPLEVRSLLLVGRVVPAVAISGIGTRQFREGEICGQFGADGQQRGDWNHCSSFFMVSGQVHY